MAVVIYLYFALNLLPHTMQLDLFPVSINYILFGFFILCTFHRYKLSITKDTYPMMLLVLLSITSIAYAPDKLDAVKQVLSLIFVCLIGMRASNIFTAGNITLLIKSFSLLCVVYVIISFFTLSILRDWEGAYIGLSGNRHNSSFLLGLMALINIVNLVNFRALLFKLLSLSLFFLCNYIIFETTARIGYFLQIVFLIFFIPYFIVSSSKLVKSLIIFFLVCSFIFLLSLDSVQEYIIFSIERGATGRNEINEVLLDFLSFHGGLFYLFGFGFGSLEHYSLLSKLFIRDANNIIAALFTLGGLGVWLYILIFYKMIRFYFSNLFCLEKIIYSTFFFAIFLIPSETTWFNFNYVYTFFMYFFYFIAFKDDNYVYKKR